MSDEIIPDSLKVEALETMFMSAGWRVAKQVFAQQASALKSRAVSGATELEVVRSVAAMAAYENAANIVEQIAATLKRSAVKK